MTNYTLTTPSTNTTTKTISSFTINAVNGTPFTSCICYINLLDASGNLLSNQFIDLSGNDYSSWGNNDQYLITYIEGKIPTLSL